MPFVLIFVGIVALIIGVRGKQDEAVTLLREEWTGPNNILTWAAGLLAIGAVGYVPGFAGLSRAFLILVLLVMFLAPSQRSGGGFFEQLQRQLFNRMRQPDAPATSPPSPAPAGQSTPGGLPALPPLLNPSAPGN